MARKTKIRIGMAPGWRELHKKSSVVFGLLVAAFSAVVSSAPYIAQAWTSMPAELKAVIPADVQQYIGYTVFALTFLALRYTSIKPKDDGHGET